MEEITPKKKRAPAPSPEPEPAPPSPFPVAEAVVIKPLTKGEQIVAKFLQRAGRV